MALDVDTASFEERVIRRSHELPVVVDFWAEWCGPCRTLTPVLEREAERRSGEVELVKVDTDRNPDLAMRFETGSIPAVKAFRDGEVVDEFVGAQAPAVVERFFDSLVPSEADRLVDAGDEESLRRALALDPRNLEAARALGRLLVARGDADEALTILGSFQTDFIASGLAARAELSGEGGGAPVAAEDGAGGDLSPAFAAWDEGDRAAALEGLQAALAAEQDPDRRDLIRRAMVAIFTELGPEDPLAREHRRRLAATLN